MCKVVDFFFDEPLVDHIISGIIGGLELSRNLVNF